MRRSKRRRRLCQHVLANTSVQIHFRSQKRDDALTTPPSIATNNSLNLLLFILIFLPSYCFVSPTESDEVAGSWPKRRIPLWSNKDRHKSHSQHCYSVSDHKNMVLTTFPSSIQQKTLPRYHIATFCCRVRHVENGGQKATFRRLNRLAQPGLDQHPNSQDGSHGRARNASKTVRRRSETGQPAGTNYVPGQRVSDEW